ncbi:hypothetical protein [Streptomyces sp. NPDC016845]|uniref:hypothetical protein n=1 Tax=Streptomyces sp. NPDC016845 TaxID=3364972 RepID=UPI0037AF8E06
MADSTFSKISWTEFRPDQRRLVTGATLWGAGLLVSAVGMGVLAYEVVRAGRTWTGGWEVPPTEMASRAFHQAQSAAQAGRDAWLSYQETPLR